MCVAQELGLFCPHTSKDSTKAQQRPGQFSLKRLSSANACTVNVAILCDTFNIGVNTSVVGNKQLSVTEQLFF